MTSIYSPNLQPCMSRQPPMLDIQTKMDRKHFSLCIRSIFPTKPSSNISSLLEAHSLPEFSLYAKYACTVCCVIGLRVANNLSAWIPAVCTRCFEALTTLAAVCPCIVSASSARAIAMKTLSAAARTAGFCLIARLAVVISTKANLRLTDRSTAQETCMHKAQLLHR